MSPSQISFSSRRQWSSDVSVAIEVHWQRAEQAAELVVARHAPLAIADDVDGRDVDGIAIVLAGKAPEFVRVFAEAGGTRRFGA